MKIVSARLSLAVIIGFGAVSHAYGQKKEASPEGGVAGGAANCFVSNCPTDINGNASVNVQDLLSVISAWGPCPSPCAQATCPADVSPAGGDCAVNVSDLLSIISAWGTCPPPPNDNCANSPSLNLNSTGGYAVKAFCTINATTDGPAHATCNFCCNDPQISKDVWYHFATSEFGSNYWVELNTCGSPFDTKIAVYRAPGVGGCTCPVTGMALVACNDDIGDGSACDLNSRVRFQASASSCYLVRVGGFANESGPGVLNSRAFRTGDECFNAVDLGTVTANNALSGTADTAFVEVTAGTIVTQAPCTPFNDGRDYWFKFQIGCGGNVLGSVHTCDPFTEFDTIVTLYRGTCDNLVLVDCNDDYNFSTCLLNGLVRKSLVDLPTAASPGYYYVRVSGYQGAVGDFNLRVALSCIN